MKLTKHDIGGELISIITKGMYSDPKDALREYVQNGVDAMSKNMAIRIKPDSITIIDDGRGMTKTVMRKAIRVGISEKNPKKSVGFMGIGIYSSFHLCNTLTVYSKVKDESPNKLIFNFGKMREFLENQKDNRITSIKPQEQIDLQTLLENSIELIPLSNDEFPSVGTRVEMSGIEHNFFKSLSRYEELSEYLETVVPLPFNPEFIFAHQIQEHIDKVCRKYKAAFRIINLELDINGSPTQLYRPYLDEDFKDGPQKPVFFEMNSSDGFLGIAWGCLAIARSTISNEKVRGFIIKKQGFTIGRRNSLLQYFGRQTYFNRYVGEFIVLNPRLLPNGPRTDFEYSSIRTTFYGKLQEVALKFNDHADEYQEEQKAEEQLGALINIYNETTAQLEFFENNGDKLLEFHRNLTEAYDKVEKKIKAGRLVNSNNYSIAHETLTKSKKLISQIRGLLDVKKKKTKSASKRSPKSIAKNLMEPLATSNLEPEPNNLVDIFNMIGIELAPDLKSVIELIDEKFIQATSKERTSYVATLVALKEEIESLFESE
jgi:hypothetical protein